mgnify:CR=1 FL=1
MKEVEFLRTEIKELKKAEKLRNLKIAFVGGLDRLKQHYREVVKSLDCELHYHSGNGRKNEIRKIVRKCDLVFCLVKQSQCMRNCKKDLQEV